MSELAKDISLRHKIVRVIDTVERAIFEARLEESTSGEIQITVYKLQKGEWVRRFYDTDWPFTDKGYKDAMRRAEYILYNNIGMMDVLWHERRD